MKTFIDTRQVQSFRDFIEAVNRGFVEPLGGEWKGSLDAFNDHVRLVLR